MRIILYLFLTFTLLSSCTKRSSELAAVLVSAESRMHSDAAHVAAELEANKDKTENCPAGEWAKFHLLLCEAYDRTDSLQLSDSALLEVISYCRRNGSKEDLRKAYCLLARVYQEANLQGAALNYYNKALTVECGTDSISFEWAAYACARMSEIYLEQKMPERARQSLEAAGKYAARGSDARTNAMIAANYGAYYLVTGNTERCISLTDSAVNIAELAGMNQTGKRIALSLLPVYLKQGDMENARRIMEKAEGIEGNRHLARYYMYCSLYYSCAGNAAKAEEYYHKCAALGNFTFLRGVGSEIVLSLLKEENYRHTDKYLVPALLAQDSLNRATMSTSNDLVTTLDAKMHNEQQQKKKETRLYLLIFAISAIVVVVVLGTVFYVRYTRIRLRLQQEKLNNLLTQIGEREKNEQASVKSEARQSKIDRLKGSDIYLSFHDSRFTPEYNDYRALEKAINEAYDDCMVHLRDIYPSIKDYEFKTCLLVKADVPLKAIAVCLGMEQNALSMLRARLYKKMFQTEKGSAVMLDDFIRSL